MQKCLSQHWGLRKKIRRNSPKIVIITSTPVFVKPKPLHLCMYIKSVINPFFAPLARCLKHKLSLIAEIKYFTPKMPKRGFVSYIENKNVFKIRLPDCFMFKIPKREKIYRNDHKIYRRAIKCTKWQYIK
jgi:hypothetical protein